MTSRSYLTRISSFVASAIRPSFRCLVVSLLLATGLFQRWIAVARRRTHECEAARLCVARARVAGSAVQAERDHAVGHHLPPEHAVGAGRRVERRDAARRGRAAARAARDQGARQVGHRCLVPRYPRGRPGPLRQRQSHAVRARPRPRNATRRTRARIQP
eukprot:5567878-Pleurochrysis_carterae.AAC.4